MLNSISNKNLAFSEIVIALACAVGTDNSIIIDELSNQLKEFNYETCVIKISKDLLEPTLTEPLSADKYLSTRQLMNAGNELRRKYSTAILAQGVAEQVISNRCKMDASKGVAYIIDSLKHEDEVNKLKEIYTSTFYLFAINESDDDRKDYLEKVKIINCEETERLIERDAEESLDYGQHTKRVFQLADFHLSFKGWKDKKKKYKNITREILKKDKQPIISKQLTRILDLLFGNPYITPTFDEYAMFMAYSSSLRSADLSRQVGAVIANGCDIISTGANDVPAPGGGQYWPGTDLVEYCDNRKGYDKPDSRDYTLGFDPNKHEIDTIINEIVNSFDYGSFDSNVYKGMTLEEYKNILKQQLLQSPLKDLTEFSRAVHAEMAAMLTCGRIGVSLKDSTLYCTTFPCHNCARHAIFAGIKRLVFIEPYLKSKAANLHKDAVSIGEDEDEEHDLKVVFEQFAGVGPRRFYDLFSMKLSTGRDIIRKSNDYIIPFVRSKARLRCEVATFLYLKQESVDAAFFMSNVKEINHTA